MTKAKTIIEFPKEININDFSKVVKEAKYGFDEAIEALAKELKKSGVQFPENKAEEIAYSDRSCKWGKKFDKWTETSYAFDEKGYQEALAFYRKEKSKAINSLLTLETTEDHPLYEEIELYLEEGEIKPIFHNHNQFTRWEARQYMDLIVHCLCQGGDGLVKFITRYDSSPEFALSENDKNLGIQRPD